MLFECAVCARASTSPRSTGFCAIWGCIRSSSSSECFVREGNGASSPSAAQEQGPGYAHDRRKSPWAPKDPPLLLRSQQVDGSSADNGALERVHGTGKLAGKTAVVSVNYRQSMVVYGGLSFAQLRFGKENLVT